MGRYYNGGYTRSIKSEATDIEQIISRLEGISALSEYHEKIIKDLRGFYSSKGYLTDSQYSFLSKINDQYTDVKLSENAEWYSNYNDDLRTKFDIVCQYYDGTGYFSSIVRQWKENKNWVPNKEQYERIAQNNYAKRLLESHNKQSDFNLGDLVCVRANANRNSIRADSSTILRNVYNSKLANAMVFVIDNNVMFSGEIYRYYKVFLMTDPSVIFHIREKDLKKYKGK